MKFFLDPAGPFDNIENVIPPMTDLWQWQKPDNLLSYASFGTTPANKVDGIWRVDFVERDPTIQTGTSPTGTRCVNYKTAPGMMDVMKRVPVGTAQTTGDTVCFAPVQIPKHIKPGVHRILYTWPFYLPHHGSGLELYDTAYIHVVASADAPGGNGLSPQYSERGNSIGASSFTKQQIDNQYSYWQQVPFESKKNHGDWLWGITPKGATQPEAPSNHYVWPIQGLYKQWNQVPVTAAGGGQITWAPKKDTPYDARVGVAAPTPAPAPVPAPLPATPTPPAPPAGGLTAYTMAEVAKHATPNDCWLSAQTKVFDASGFNVNHPGGRERIEAQCGKDVTALIWENHGTFAHLTNVKLIGQITGAGFRSVSTTPTKVASTTLLRRKLLSLASEDEEDEKAQEAEFDADAILEGDEALAAMFPAQAQHFVLAGANKHSNSTASKVTSSIKLAAAQQPSLRAVSPLDGQEVLARHCAAWW